MNTVLFDLDGTLLRMDQDQFVSSYMKALAGRFAGQGYIPEYFMRSMMMAVKAVIKNDGTMRNEERFWQVFAGELGDDIREKDAEFMDFYKTEFPKLSYVAEHSDKARRVVDLLKTKGYDLVLATNPLFPQTATYQRVSWAGLKPEDFSFITTYENSSFCKPFPAYFTELLEKLGKKPEECMMVGNDVDDDILSSAQLGMKNYLITDYLINRKEKDLTHVQTGDFDAFIAFAEGLPDVSEGSEE